MRIASCKGDYTAGQAAHVHRRTAVISRTVAQFAVRVISPTLDATVVGHCTGVISASCQSNHAVGQATHVHWRAAVVGCPVAQLTVLIMPPAHDAAVGQGTGVRLAGCQSFHATGQAAHVHWRTALIGRPVAQLTSPVIPPALDRTATGRRTGMIPTRFQDYHIASKPVHIYRVLRAIAVPSPSCPPQLPPQHLTPPLLVSAQVCHPPADMAVTSPVRPLTSIGVLRLVIVPSPSWPFPFHPQHLTLSPLVSAQV